MHVHQATGPPDGQAVEEFAHPPIVGRPGVSLCHSRSMQFSVQSSERSGRTVLTVAGELDVHTAPELESTLGPLTRLAGAAVVVDLTAVKFIDSTGLGVLVTGLKHVREHDGSLDVVATTPRVLRVFSLTGLDAVIPLHATLEEALPSA